jgi:hypothetical protein
MKGVMTYSVQNALAYCGTSFQVDYSSWHCLKLKQEKDLDADSSKIGIDMLVNGFGTCTADNVHHAPYNVYATTDHRHTGLDVVWGGIVYVNNIGFLYTMIL